jgi:hypothetical protein
MADAVDQLDRLSSASPLLDVIDTGAGKLIRWNGPEPETTGSAPVEPAVRSGYCGAFAVEMSGGTFVRIYNAADPSGEDAGQIVIGSTRYDMPAGSLPITQGAAADVYLTVYYNTSTANLVYGFATTLSAAVTGAQGWYKKLAHVSSAGIVTQVHLSGDIEICGRWWH